MLNQHPSHLPFDVAVLLQDGDVEGNSALMNPLAGDRVSLRKRILSALDVVSSHEQVDASRVGAMGYCFGGMCVLELARSGADVKGVISIHGIFSPGDVPNEKIVSKILCLHGQDDPMVPPQQVLDLLLGVLRVILISL